MQTRRKKVLVQIAMGELTNDNLVDLYTDIEEVYILHQQSNQTSSQKYETIKGLNARLYKLKKITNSKHKEHTELKLNYSITEAKKKTREHIRTVKKENQLQEELEKIGISLGIKASRKEIKHTGCDFKAFDDANFNSINKVFIKSY